MNENVFCIIMAGGVGSRFWPVSRKDHPKQFLDILGTGKSFLQMTYDRFETIVPPQNFYIVTNKEYYSHVKQQLPFLDDSQILLEPIGRNTAPCIIYANQKIKARNKNAKIIVTPSDHLILETDKFLNDIKKGLDFIENNDSIITLGIKPTRPNTGYGYIQIGVAVETKNSIYKVKTFTEKPNEEMAKIFVESGEFLWNSGMFIWTLNVIENAYKQFLPEIYNAFNSNFEKINSEKEEEIIETIYNDIKSISIDYGIIEKTEGIHVIKSSFTWSDIGTWLSLYENKTKDANDNVVSVNEALIYETKSSLIYTTLKDKIYVVKGFSDIILVDTDDALLLIKKKDEQSIKQIVDDIKIENKENFL